MFNILKCLHKNLAFILTCRHIYVPWYRQSSSALTVGYICKDLTKRLEQQNVPEAKISIDLMVAHVLGKTTVCMSVH